MPLFVLCGGALRKFPEGDMLEVEHMFNKCIEFGVPMEDNILEKESQNTVENILFALVELQRAFWLKWGRKESG
ncbi:MAG: hypothetical protein MRZ84_07265 [Eubacterium sp.]|nr:hypothetical protein [Eubacterium sp.]